MLVSTLSEVVSDSDLDLLVDLPAGSSLLDEELRIL